MSQTKKTDSMALCHLLILISLLHRITCLRTSYWTTSSKFNPTAIEHFQNWTSLPHCVKACLERDDCNAILVKNGVRGTKRQCALFYDRFLHTQDNTILNQFLTYVPRNTVAGGSATDHISFSKWAELEDKDDAFIDDVNGKDETFPSTTPQTAIISETGLGEMETSSASDAEQGIGLQHGLKTEQSHPQHEIKKEVEQFTSEARNDEIKFSQSTNNLFEKVEPSTASTTETQPSSSSVGGQYSTRQSTSATGRPTSYPRKSSNKDRGKSITIPFTPATVWQTLPPRKSRYKDRRQSVTLPFTSTVGIQPQSPRTTWKTDQRQSVTILPTPITGRQTVYPRTTSFKDLTQTKPTPATQTKRVHFAGKVVQSLNRTQVQPSTYLVVLPQYTTGKRKKEKKPTIYVLNPETWTFINRRVYIPGKILRTVVDFKTMKIYWLQYMPKYKVSVFKSRSISKEGSRYRQIRIMKSNVMDIDIPHNTFYFVEMSRKWMLAFKRCIVLKTHISPSLQKAKQIYTFPRKYKMSQMMPSCFRVDQDRLYWCRNRETHLKMYTADLKHRDRHYMKLELKTADAYIYPFKKYLYWTDRLGNFSVSTFKDKKTKRISGCGSRVESLGSIGRYGGFWYLTCYTGEITEIHFYDDEMKKVKSLQVEFEGIVASAY